MKKTLALAATLAAGIALAPMAGEAATVSATIGGDLGERALGSTVNFFKTNVSGPATDAWTFSVPENVIGAAVAINLDFPSSLTISAVQIVKGNISGTVFNFDNPDNILASGIAGQTITALLSDADEPFAVIIERSGGPASYSGLLSVAPVPVPAALPLFLTALAGLGLIGRRRMQAAA